jgi:molybdate transport system substrate-binding protein
MKTCKWIGLLIALILILSMLSGCAPNENEAVTLTVMAAASLTTPLFEIGTLFEQNNPHATVEFTFAGSQQFAAQLGSGAAADVLVTANRKTMEESIAAGRVTAGSEQLFAGNRLVVIVPAANLARIFALKDLARPGLKLVLAAKEVPVGQYSLEFLENASADPDYGSTYRQAVLDNTVSYEENVKAVLAKVALGEADAGIVYLSDAGGEVGSRVGKLEIPTALNVTAFYPIAPIANSVHPAEARAFIDLVLSKEGQAILARAGFTPVE